MHWVLCAVYLSIVTLITIFMLREGKKSKSTQKVMQKQVSDASKPIYRTAEVWTVGRALRTWQFYLIAATYTSFLWCGITVNSFAVAHIEERGFGMTVAVSLLHNGICECILKVYWWSGSEWLEPKKLLIGSLIIMVLGVISSVLPPHGFGLFYLCYALVLATA